MEIYHDERIYISDQKMIVADGRIIYDTEIETLIYDVHGKNNWTSGEDVTDKYYLNMKYFLDGSWNGSMIGGNGDIKRWIDTGKKTRLFAIPKQVKTSTPILDKVGFPSDHDVAIELISRYSNNGRGNPTSKKAFIDCYNWIKKRLSTIKPIPTPENIQARVEELYPCKYGQMSSGDGFRREGFIRGAKEFAGAIEGDGWIDVKPKADKEFIMVTASKFKTHWEYNVWIVQKLEGDDGWYYGLLAGDGEEWGDYDDLKADLYKIISPKL